LYLRRGCDQIFHLRWRQSAVLYFFSHYLSYIILYDIRFLILFPLSTMYIGLQQRRGHWLPRFRSHPQARRFWMQREPAPWFHNTILVLPKYCSKPIRIGCHHNYRHYYDCCPTIHSPVLVILYMFNGENLNCSDGTKARLLLHYLQFSCETYLYYIPLLLYNVLGLYVFKNNKTLV